MRDFIRDICLPVLILLGVLLMLYLPFHFALRAECAAYAQPEANIRTEVRYNTCYVNNGDRWYRWDEWVRRSSGGFP